MFHYCEKSGNNHRMSVDGKTVYYSYDTIVAFEVNGEKFVSENCWGTTTGKHLNAIEPNKKKRLKRADFEAKLKEYNLKQK